MIHQSLRPRTPPLLAPQKTPYVTDLKPEGVFEEIWCYSPLLYFSATGSSSCLQNMDGGQKMCCLEFFENYASIINYGGNYCQFFENYASIINDCTCFSCCCPSPNNRSSSRPNMVSLF